MEIGDTVSVLMESSVPVMRNKNTDNRSDGIKITLSCRFTKHDFTVLYSHRERERKREREGEQEPATTSGDPKHPKWSPKALFVCETE